MTRTTLVFAFVSCVAALELGPSQDLRAQGRQGLTPLPPLPVSQIDEGRQQPPTRGGEPLPVTRIDEQRREDPLQRGQPFSLTFSQAQPIRELLLVLVHGTNLNVVIDPGVEGTFTGELNNVTLREALDAILHPIGLDYSVQGNTIHVFKRRIETRIFPIDAVMTRRTGTRALSATSSAGGGGGLATGGVPGAAGGAATAAGGAGGLGAGGGGAGSGGSSASVSGTDAGDLFDELTNALRANLLSSDGHFNLDRKSGVLRVADYPDRLDEVAVYLETVMTRVHRQVQIQAKVLEIVLQDETQTGINWSQVFASAGNSVTQNVGATAGGAFTFSLNIKNFTALLSAFATQGKVNVLSSPRVMTMNNEPAVMRVGTQDVFFVTTTQVNPQTGQVLQTTVTPQPLTEGVVLSVTPQISADGIINMSISPSVTERTGQATSRLGDTVPIVSVRETDTIVRVREGQTVVIGGLMQDRLSIDTTKVPVLGDLPGIGGLFRRQNRAKRKTDLVILLTPTVLNPNGMAEIAASDQERLYQERQPEPVRPRVKR